MLRRMRILLPCFVVVAACQGLGDVAEAAVPAGSNARIAFVRTQFVTSNLKKTSTSIILSRASGKGQQTIIRGTVHNRLFIESLSWSPDGEWLVFDATPRLYGTHSDLYLIKADGTQLHMIPGAGDATQPEFAPDGDTIAYSLERPNPSGDADPIQSVWLIQRNGSNLRELTPRVADEYNYPSDFAPDGALAYTHITCNNPLGKCYSLIRKVDLNGSNDVLVQNDAIEPSYSPNGAMLLFGSFRDNNGSTEAADGYHPTDELYRSNINGSGQVRLTHTHRLNENESAWDPSGSRIAYVTSNEYPGPLMQMNPAGHCRRKIAFGGLANYTASPEWRPGFGREAAPLHC